MRRRARRPRENDASPRVGDERRATDAPPAVSLPPRASSPSSSSEDEDESRDASPGAGRARKPGDDRGRPGDRPRRGSVGTAGISSRGTPRHRGSTAARAPREGARRSGRVGRGARRKSGRASRADRGGRPRGIATRERNAVSDRAARLRGERASAAQLAHQPTTLALLVVLRLPLGPRVLSSSLLSTRAARRGRGGCG